MEDGESGVWCSQRNNCSTHMCVTGREEGGRGGAGGEIEIIHKFVNACRNRSVESVAYVPGNDPAWRRVGSSETSGPE